MSLPASHSLRVAVRVSLLHPRPTPVQRLLTPALALPANTPVPGTVTGRPYTTPIDATPAPGLVHAPSTLAPKKYAKYVPPEVETFAGPSPRRTYATTSDFVRPPSPSSPKSAQAQAPPLERPPPPSKQPEVETFSAPSKPRAYYARPERDLPPLQRKWPYAFALALLGGTTWAAFYFYAANQERLSSSVMRQVLATLRDDPDLAAALGDALRPEPVWWLNGDPVVNGAIHLLQGTVDLSFRVKGHRGAGTVYFTSIRKAKGEPFTILRFRVICDNGQVVEIPVRELSS